MVKLEWGTKRVCQSCAARFYDLRRSPIICPKCEAVYEMVTTSRRTRKSASADDLKVLPLTEEELLASDIEIGVDIGDDDDLIADDDDLDADLDNVVDVISDEDSDNH